MASKNYYDLLSEALKLHHHKDVVSIIGAGGKSATLFRLGNELSNIGKKVILTTTAHLDNDNLDILRLSSELTPRIIKQIEHKYCKEPVLIAKRLVRGQQIKGLSLKQIAQLNRDVVFDYMLIEADISENKSLNAPHKFDIGIPPCTTHLIVVMGFDIIGKKLCKHNVYRPQLVARILSRPLESTISVEDLFTVLTHPSGLLKGRPPATRTSVILNKVPEGQFEVALKLSDRILNSPYKIDSVICGQIDKTQQLLLFS